MGVRFETRLVSYLCFSTLNRQKAPDDAFRHVISKPLETNSVFTVRILCKNIALFKDFRPLNCANSRLLFNSPNISPITKQELRRWWCQQTRQHHVMGSFLELAKPIYKQMSSLQMAATTFYQARWGENGLINSSLKAGFGGKKSTLYSIMIILVKVGKKLVKNYIALSKWCRMITYLGFRNRPSFPNSMRNKCF